MRIGLPEQTWIDYQPASFGSRALAYVTDFALRWTVVVIGIAVLLFLFSQVDGEELFVRLLQRLNLRKDSSFVFAFIGVIVFLVEWSYPVYFEVLKDGVTPGKRLLGLRVVNETGLPISWKASVLRTVLLTVDILPGFGLVALVSMFVTGRAQRLGDLVAGTLVIYDFEQEETFSRAAENEERQTVLIPLEVYNLLENYLARRDEIVPEFRPNAQKVVVRALESVTSVLPPPLLLDAASVDGWLDQVSRAVRPAKRSVRACNSRPLDWSAVDAELRTAHEKLSLMESADDSSEQGLFSAADSYQRICQRYAYLSTFYPQSKEARTAARLVRYGRRLIYQRRLESVKDDNVTLFERLGRGFQAVRGAVLLSTVIGVGSGVLTALLVVLNPNLGWHFLNEQVAADLAQGRLWTESIEGANAVVSSGIMRNNIGVSFFAFALGITGGIGSVLLLVFNGALLGGIFAALAPYRMTLRLAEFVVAHGVLELSVIVVATACGLYLGDGLLQPGNLTRLKSLQKRGRLILDLLLFSALSLIPAAITEGYISPDAGVPIALKVTIGLMLGSLYWGVLFMSARRASQSVLFPLRRERSRSNSFGNFG